MQKIEELTLYLIEQDKALKSLRNELENIKTKGGLQNEYPKKYFMGGATICMLMCSLGYASSNDVLSWQLLDDQGKPLQGSIGKFPKEIHVGELSTDIYIIVLQTTNRTVKTKLIVQA